MGTTNHPLLMHEWPSLRLVRPVPTFTGNLSERFQTSCNDNHEERDLRRLTLVLIKIHFKMQNVFILKC